VINLSDLSLFFRLRRALETTANVPDLASGRTESLADLVVCGAPQRAVATDRSFLQCMCLLAGYCGFLVLRRHGGAVFLKRLGRPLRTFSNHARQALYKRVGKSFGFRCVAYVGKRIGNLLGEIADARH
jgi:hypothetical protein